MKRTSSAVVIAFAAIFVVFAFVRVAAPDEGNAEVTAVPHFQLADVKVRITAEPIVSRGQDPMLVQLESGAIPEGVTRLAVLTDENCQPDADGVSHCLNRVQFVSANGVEEAVLRHHHNMAEERCLSPGQNVELVG